MKIVKFNSFSAHRWSNQSFHMAHAKKVVGLCRIVVPVALSLLALLSYPSGFGLAEDLQKPLLRAERPGKTLMYHGAWFNVRYPSDFRARPGQPAIGAESGSDSAFFTAPDRSVEFYVYSPLGNGVSGFTMLSPGETQMSANIKTTKYQGSLDPVGLPAGATVSPGDSLRVIWITVQNKKRGYYRSWKQWDNTTLNISFTFGIKYRDAKSLARYRPEYLAFRSSLEQFGD